MCGTAPDHPARSFLAADAEVSEAEFSAFVDGDARFEVRQGGSEVNGGASGGAPVGGCTLVRLGSDSTDFLECPRPTD